MCTRPAHRRAGSGPLRHLPRGTTRRDVLRLTLGSLGLTALGPLALRRLPVAAGAPQSQTRLIVFNLVGGCDALNTVVPLTVPEYYARRPNVAIPAGQELSLNAGPNATTAYGLHPALDQIQALWNEGSAALIRKVGYPQENLSHFTSMDVYSYGVRGDFLPLGIPVSGWIARYADQHAPTPMGAVAVGVGRPVDVTGGSTNPVAVTSLAGFQFQADPGNAADQQHRLALIQSVLSGFAGAGLSSEAKAALETGHQLAAQIQAAVAGYTTAVAWPATPIGQFLRDVSTLIEGGFETRVFYTGYGGFDLHGGMGGPTGAHATLLQRLDDAVGALAQDLKNRGQWNDTRIVVITEFGRRNYENASLGLDHGHAATFLELGGGLSGGLHGPAISSADVQAEYLPYAVDFRDVYRDVITNHLGGSAAAVFPESQPISTSLGIA